MMNATARFKDRLQAGEMLAERLIDYAGNPDVVAVALPRGGVPVGFSIARMLQAPLDILLVRKLGVPGNEELAMGAVTSGGRRVLIPNVITAFDVSEKDIDDATSRELREIAQQEQRYCIDAPSLDRRGRIVIVIDDGLATGATMRAAIQALRQEQPARVIVVTPVAAAESCEELRDEVDDIVCLHMAEPLFSVGLWYQDFSQVPDREVKELLARAAIWRAER